MLSGRILRIDVIISKHKWILRYIRLVGDDALHWIKGEGRRLVELENFARLLFRRPQFGSGVCGFGFRAAQN